MTHRSTVFFSCSFHPPQQEPFHVLPTVVSFLKVRTLESRDGVGWSSLVSCELRPLWFVGVHLYWGHFAPRVHVLLRCSDPGQQHMVESEFLVDLTFIEEIALKWQGTLISAIREFPGEFRELTGSWESDLKHSWSRYSLWWGWDSCVCSVWFYTEPAGMKCGQPQRPGKFNSALAGPLSLSKPSPMHLCTNILMLSIRNQCQCLASCDWLIGWFNEHVIGLFLWATCCARCWAISVNEIDPNHCPRKLTSLVKIFLEILLRESGADFHCADHTGRQREAC